MWVLRPVTEGKDTYWLKCGEYTVGRKGTRIVIGNDSSVSRLHATVKVESIPESRLNDPGCLPTVTVLDSSKFGTFLNEVQLAQEETAVSLGDLIAFGRLGSAFRLTYEPLVVCVSSLNESSKSALTKSVRSLGGHVINKWTDRVTHLAIDSFSTTVKIVCSLIAHTPRTTTAYFIELDKFYEAKTTQCCTATLSDFVPPVLSGHESDAELARQTLPARKTLFKDLTFYFFSTGQLKKMELPITLAGGRAELFLSGEGKSVDPARCHQAASDPNSMVMHLEEKRGLTAETSIVTSSVARTLKRALTKANKRLIQNAEIYQAVLHGSRRLYCNPQETAGKQLFNTLSQASLSSQLGCVADSMLMDSSASAAAQPKILIAETITETPTPAAPASTGRVIQSDISSSSERKRGEFGSGARSSKADNCVVDNDGNSVTLRDDNSKQEGNGGPNHSRPSRKRRDQESPSSKEEHEANRFKRPRLPTTSPQKQPTSSVTKRRSGSGQPQPLNIGNKKTASSKSPKSLAPSPVTDTLPYLGSASSSDISPQQAKPQGNKRRRSSQELEHENLSKRLAESLTCQESELLVNGESDVGLPPLGGDDSDVKPLLDGALLCSLSASHRSSLPHKKRKVAESSERMDECEKGWIDSIVGAPVTGEERGPPLEEGDDSDQEINDFSQAPLPRYLCITQTVPLLRTSTRPTRSPAPSQLFASVCGSNASQSPNFKRFRKVWSASQRVSQTAPLRRRAVHYVSNHDSNTAILEEKEMSANAVNVDSNHDNVGTAFGDPYSSGEDGGAVTLEDDQNSQDARIAEMFAM